jgi:hypothetical protein
MGLGRIVHPVKDQLGILERVLADPRLSHVHMDISWDETAKYLVATPETIEAAAHLINHYPDRFLFGSDEVAPTDPAKYYKVYDLYAPLWRSSTRGRGRSCCRELRAALRCRPGEGAGLGEGQRQIGSRGKEGGNACG